jgi:hypothetical protein
VPIQHPYLPVPLQLGPQQGLQTSIQTRWGRPIDANIPGGNCPSRALRPVDHQAGGSPKAEDLPRRAAARAGQQQIMASGLGPQAAGPQAFFRPQTRLQTDLQAGFVLANQQGSTQVQYKSRGACWGRAATHSQQPCPLEIQLQLGPCERHANPSRLQEWGRIDPHLIRQGMLGLPWNLQGRAEPLQIKTPIGATMAGETQLTLEHIKGQPNLGAPGPDLTAPDPGSPLGPAVDQDLVTPAFAFNIRAPI